MRTLSRFKKTILPFISIVLLLQSLNFLGCREISTHKIKVVTTTTLIATLVKAIGKDKIDVVTIVPGGMCPGHFDVKPDDIKKLSTAKVLINHGWEVWTSDLLNSVENENLLTKTIKIEGNWMIPNIQILAGEEITKTLCEIDPQNSPFYKKNLNHYKKEVNSVAVEVKNTDFQGKKVVCSEYQAEFLKWLGFKVVATYESSEDPTIKNLAEIMSTAKRENVHIVIDNLQSGSKVGEQIAEEIGAKYIVLTNFPLSDSYTESLKENIHKLACAVE